MSEPSTTPYRPSPLLIHPVIGLTNIIFGFTLAIIRPALIPAIFAIVLTWAYFAAVYAPKRRPGADAWVIGTVAREQITPLYVFNSSSSSIIAILYLNIVVILWLTTFIIFIVLSAEDSYRWRDVSRPIFPTILSGAVWILMSYILLRTAVAWRKEKKNIAMETDQQILFSHPEQGASGVISAQESRDEESVVLVEPVIEGPGSMANAWKSGN